MIKIYRKFFTDSQLDSIADAIKNHCNYKWNKSASVGRNTTESYDTDRVADFVAAPSDVVDSAIVSHLIDTINSDFDMDLYPHESWSIQKYRAEARGHFYWHQDVLDFFIYREELNAEQQFVRNAVPNRKVSISVALNNRNEYEGGQFKIDFGDGRQSPVDLDRGDMIVFTSDTFHGVDDVTDGSRNALIIWLIDKEEFKAWEELCLDLDLENP